MEIHRLDHVNIRTAELGRMTAFYTEVLGLEPGWRPDFGFPGAWLYCGDDAAIHLVGVDSAPQVTQVRMEHFALRATGLAAFLARLKQNEIAYNISLSPGTKTRMVNLYDPDANHIEIQFVAAEEADLSPYDPA